MNVSSLPLVRLVMGSGRDVMRSGFGCVSERGSRVQGRTKSPHRNTGGIVRVLAAFLALASCTGSNGTSEPPPTTPAAYRVLFIGNSLTSFNDLPGTVAGL